MSSSDAVVQIFLVILAVYLIYFGIKGIRKKNNLLLFNRLNPTRLNYPNSLFAYYGCIGIGVGLLLLTIGGLSFS